MSKTAKRNVRSHSASKKDRAVIYRGIRIEPIIGKRSEVAKKLRDALRSKPAPSGGEAAHA